MRDVIIILCHCETTSIAGVRLLSASATPAADVMGQSRSYLHFRERLSSDGRQSR
jgi:hypothetical protein